jgi:ABC-type branched-subunit amino acid transport system substrate-binding protein
MKTNQFNGASALTGFAIGVIITFLAVINFVPAERPSSDTGLAVGGFGVADPEALEEELAEGEVIVDSQGRVIRTGGGKAATQAAAAAAAGGSKSTASGGSKSTTPGGSGTEGRAGGGAGSGANVSGGDSGGSGSGSTGGGEASCAAGRNGGGTAPGVTATQILLGATVAEEGIAKEFLGEVSQGMEAQVKKVNRAGGICGRQLKVIYKQDSWDPQTGARYIQNLVEGDGVFALAVSPSSEGLNVASKQHYFRTHKVPVVGADGLNVTQFTDPFIWPVAAATITTIDVMMKDAWDRSGGSLRPAVVYGNGYRFGIEGAYAANKAYERLSGKSIEGYKNPLSSSACEQRFCGVSPETGQYGTQVGTIKQACQFGTANACNFMILLLEPTTALQWMSTPGVPVPSDFAHRISAPQPLFTYDFAYQCKDKCDQMWVWTGYNPPIDKYQSAPAVVAFVNELAAQSASADKFNQFTMGGYIGMGLMIEALKQVGPTLTRQALVDKLNSMAAYESGLAPPLKWTAGERYANHSAQAFRVEARNGFTGTWAHVRDPIRDPWLGQHTPPE